MEDFNQEGNNHQKSHKDIMKEIPKANRLWDDIGFHRPLGGFWYKFLLEISIIIIPIFLVSFMLKLIYPYPTSQGYKDTFSGIFILVFILFDIGTSSTISRFVADENIKNPRKMIQYVQYFIWYQMITGLAQITLISAFALYVVPNTPLAYGTWIILLVITKQWPGFPGVFKGTLNALQQFNRKNMIEFIQGEAFQRITEIVFVLIGRWWGMVNPEIGELLGISLGAVIGLYVDDLIAAFLSAYYVAKTLKPYGITFKKLFMPEFDKELVIRCTIFGIKTGFPGVVSGATEFIALTLMLTNIPQYTTYITLKGMAVSLVAITQRLTDQDFTPLFTEAYQNGKIKLCQYYNAHALRFFAINSGFAVAIMLTVISMFQNIFLGLGLDRYLLTVPFLIPALIYRASQPYVNYPGKILIAANKPTFLMILNFFQQGGRIFFLWLTILIFRVQDFGIFGIVYAITLGDFPAIIIKTIIAFIYINRRVFKMKLMIWQTFIAPAAATATLFTIFWLFKVLFLEILFAWNFYAALGVGIGFLMILVLILYFPLTVSLGGWDENSMRDFRKAVKMSGPSKGLVRMIAKGVFWAERRASWHNRFKYNDDGVFREIQELVETRDRNRKKLDA
ncbi:MAG: hypothetical protein ACTSUE_17505 [Promethearchaeota archaeon]